MQTPTSTPSSSPVPPRRDQPLPSPENVVGPLDTKVTHAAKKQKMDLDIVTSGSTVPEASKLQQKEQMQLPVVGKVPSPPSSPKVPLPGNPLITFSQLAKKQNRYTKVWVNTLQNLMKLLKKLF